MHIWVDSVRTRDEEIVVYADLEPNFNRAEKLSKILRGTGIRGLRKNLCLRIWKLTGRVFLGLKSVRGSKYLIYVLVHILSDIRENKRIEYPGRWEVDCSPTSKFENIVSYIMYM